MSARKKQEFETFIRKVDVSPDRPLKTVNIKGKDYVMVHERVKAFKEWFGTFGSIETVIESYDSTQVLIRANVYLYLSDENGDFKYNPISGEPIRIKVATGIGQEYKGNSGILATSFVEVAETSAIGRALGFSGIGIENGIASAEEVRTAINVQKSLDPTPSVSNTSSYNAPKNTPPPYNSAHSPNNYQPNTPPVQAPTALPQPTAQQTQNVGDMWTSWSMELSQITQPAQLMSRMSEMRQQISNDPGAVQRFEQEILPLGNAKFQELTQQS